MKIGTLSLAILVVFGLMASTGMADYVGMAVLEQGWYSSGDGGEFNVTLTYAPDTNLYVISQNAPVQVASAIGAGTGTPGVVAVFQTFCIQEGHNDVDFSPGTMYAATVEEQAYNHNSGSAGIQTLSPITAALLNAFWTGTLSSEGYDYLDDGGRSTSAAELQAAIWYAQGDNDLSDALNEALGGTASSAELTAAQDYYNWGNTPANQTFDSSVQILGLYDTEAEALTAGQGGIDQAQLVEAIYTTGQAFPSVPLPTAAQGIMVLCSIMGLSRVRRRARDLA
jgi:hypothetical protein